MSFPAKGQTKDTNFVIYNPINDGDNVDISCEGIGNVLINGVLPTGGGGGELRGMKRAPSHFENRNPRTPNRQPVQMPTHRDPPLHTIPTVLPKTGRRDSAECRPM